jgi:aminomethyltransferase
LKLSLVALQGPSSQKIMEDLTGQDLSKFAFMTAKDLNVAGIDCYVTRCGYTGEDGFEISVQDDKVVELSEKLVKHHDCELAGLGARDSLRLEAGLCLYGHDLNEDITPVEATLLWTIGLENC